MGNCPEALIFALLAIPLIFDSIAFIFIRRADLKLQFSRRFLRRISQEDYSLLMAPIGQTSTQVPQSTHSSSSTTAQPSSSLIMIASTGHSSTQVPQHVHSSLSIFTAISFNSLFHVLFFPVRIGIIQVKFKSVFNPSWSSGSRLTRQTPFLFIFFYI